LDHSPNVKEQVKVPNMITESEAAAYLELQRVLLDSDDMGLRTASETAYSLMHGAEAHSSDWFALAPDSRLMIEWSGIAYSLTWTECGDGCTKPLGHRGLHQAAEATRCNARPYPAGSEGDDGTACGLRRGHSGPHAD
jgi:hypothetical protein